jgi:hypothetical protein
MQAQALQDTAAGVHAFLLKSAGPAGAGARSRAFPQAPQHDAHSTSENGPPWTDVRPVQSRSAAGPCRL